MESLATVLAVFQPVVKIHKWVEVHFCTASTPIMNVSFKYGYQEHAQICHFLCYLNCTSPILLVLYNLEIHQKISCDNTSYTV